MLIGQDANLKGTLGYKGERGYSAYETAVQNGFEGTIQEWLDTLGTLEPNSVEFKSNKTTEVNDTSTDNQYPSAKATYDAIQQQAFTYSGDTLPIGATIEWFSDTIPSNWLLLNGQAISRTDFAELFTLYGTTFGVGNGSTTFNIPDMRDYVPVGKSASDTNINALGEKYGSKTHTLSINEIPNHNHSLSGYYGNADGAYYIKSGNNTGTLADIQTGYIGGGQAHNNMQPSIATNFIVKAKQSSGLIANVAQTFSSSTQDTYSCNYINSIENKISRKYAIAYPTAQQSLASNTQISLNAFYKNVGNKFTLSNNSVVVGAGVSKIAISGCIFAEEVDNTNYVWGQIKKNNVSIITCIVSSTCGFVSTPLPYQIIEVQEGDIISLYADSTAGGTSRIGTENTYIQLEIVE
jgi:microcystin-dependent protein